MYKCICVVCMYIYVYICMKQAFSSISARGLTIISLSKSDSLRYAT